MEAAMRESELQTHTYKYMENVCLQDQFPSPY